MSIDLAGCFLPGPALATSPRCVVVLQPPQQCVGCRRYQYDPNGRVRDAMTHIWAALVPEPRAALDTHFGAIADELLREMGGRMWRNREAACLGLADLLQVRPCMAYKQCEHRHRTQGTT